MRVIREIPLSLINTDRRTNAAKVDSYASLMRSGVRFPPVKLQNVVGGFRISDGGHRVAAARLLGIKSIRARFFLNV